MTDEELTIEEQNNQRTGNNDVHDRTKDIEVDKRVGILEELKYWIIEDRVCCCTDSKGR